MKKISESIQKIERRIQAIKKDKALKSVGLKINADFMIENLSDSKKLFSEGKKEIERVYFQESLHNCITCHTSAISNDHSLSDIDLSKLDSYRMGNFLFATEQFEKGKTEYEYTVEKFPPHKDHTKLIRSLTSLL